MIKKYVYNIAGGRYAIATATLLAITATSTVASAAESANSADEAGTIVVTARKREESLMKVPVTISAFSSEDLAARSITTITDLVENSPGINVNTVGSGRNDRSFQNISLRGFTPNPGAFSTYTAIFIDGVPVASTTALNSVTDPARIEILKGPQSAYFGRNAFAGAINIVTSEPGKDLGGRVTMQVGSRNSYDLKGSIGGPIIADILSFKITGRVFAEDGSYKNLAAGGQTLGDQKTSTGTAQLTFTPTPSLKIRAFGLYSKDNDGPSADGMVSAYELRANNGSINIPLLSGNSNGQVIVPSQSNCTLSGLQFGRAATETRVNRPFICGAIPQVAAGFSPAANTIEDKLLSSILANGANRVVSPENGTKGYGLVREYYHLHLAVDYEIGDTGLTLSSLTGYNNEFFSQVDDLDNYDGSLLNGTGVAGTRQIYNFPFGIERTAKDFSQEFRMSYDKGGALRALLGVSYLEADLATGNINIFSEERTLTPVRPASSLLAPRRSETKSIFGSLTYDISNGLTISFEGRYQEDKVFAKAGGAGTTISATNAFGFTPGTYTYGQTFFTKTYKNFLPRVIANYNVTPDIMVYASYSEGVNAAIDAFNANILSSTPGQVAALEALGLSVVQKPENLKNYEIGFKGSFFDGRARLSMAAFIADWTDQFNTRSLVILDASQNPPVTSIVGGTANSGNTRIKGLEADLWTNPVDGLTITLAGAINNSSIKDWSEPSVSQLTGIFGDGFKGNSLPYTSKYSANLGIQLNGNIANLDAGFFARGDLSYKSRQFIDAGNLTWISGRSVVNARLGYKGEKYSIELFATNLFNNRNYTSAGANVILEPSFALQGRGNGYVTVGLPALRMFGVTTGINF